jgi:hypothetical protein
VVQYQVDGFKKFVEMTHHVKDESPKRHFIITAAAAVWERRRRRWRCLILLDGQSKEYRLAVLHF